MCADMSITPLDIIKILTNSVCRHEYYTSPNN